MAKEEKRKGFTIIEVSLVLAVSGLLLVGLIAGTSGSVARQRYNDSVQSIVDYLRSIYSAVNNPQGLDSAGGNGSAGSLGESLAADFNSDWAIYGKIVYFGYFTDNGEATPIYSGTLIGQADIKYAADETAGIGNLRQVNLAQPNYTETPYYPPWSARIETTGNSGTVLSGVLIIVRSPVTGAIHSYWANGTKYSNGIRLSGTNYNISILPASTSQINEIWSLNDIINKINFTSSNINLCINSPDISAAGGTRRNIRIAADGRNASAVQLIDVDSGGNACS